MKYLNIILVAILMVACKSSEQAYRNSYQKMVGAEGASAAKTETVVITNADADGVRTERVKLVEGEGLKAYSIVCGSFSLKANAEYLIDDLRSKGYTPLLVQTLDNQKMFRVVAQTFDNRAKALEARLQLQKKYKDAWILNKRP
ncbi:MAG: SPOR domain-containing protein [Bacteroidaceae bacterium]|nr:SPOR domain-containing protein [Bacteroidaceae bacterium]